jgi:GNAT superfamily N-acetyltransferase
VADTLLSRSADAGSDRVRAWAAAKTGARVAAPSSQPPAFFHSRRSARRSARAAALAARTRRTAVLVAEEGVDGSTGGRVVGAAALLRVRAGAALPPPFPTAAPVVAYLADLAVDPSARGRGAASALLARAARRACLWGDPALWLHAPGGAGEGSDAHGGGTLYVRAGFEPPHGGGGGAGAHPRRRVLLVRQLAPPPPGRGTKRRPVDGGSGQAAGGVYVWGDGEEG